jgi:methyltransferase (TIGR00027 family)
MADRTAFIDTEVAGAIGRDVRQIVLLGAGYDGRALRFAGATRWFEVDYPSTQDDKRRRLDALGVLPAPEQVAFIGLDLMTDDLGAALDAAGHDAGSPSLFVCEGLFAYLTLEAVASVCETLRARAPEGSVLVSTYFVLPESAAAGARGRTGDAARATLRKLEGLVLSGVGEPRRSEFFAGDPQKLMVVTGWRVTRSQRTPAGRIEPAAASLVLAAEPDGLGSRAA